MMYLVGFAESTLVARSVVLCAEDGFESVAGSAHLRGEGGVVIEAAANAETDGGEEGGAEERLGAELL